MTNWEKEVGLILSESAWTVTVGFKRLNDEAILPTKAHPTDSGFDLYTSEDVIIEPGETVIVKTGIAVELPAGYEAQIRPRSGITAKTKLRVQLGTIDNDYRGELGVIVDNIHWRDDDYGFWEKIHLLDGTFELSEKIDRYKWTPEGKEYYRKQVLMTTYKIRKGDRIAQLVIQPLPTVKAYEIEGDMSETDRCADGFGSSGV